MADAQGRGRRSCDGASEERRGDGGAGGASRAEARWIRRTIGIAGMSAPSSLRSRLIRLEVMSPSGRLFTLNIRERDNHEEVVRAFQEVNGIGESDVLVAIDRFRGGRLADAMPVEVVEFDERLRKL